MSSKAALQTQQLVDEASALVSRLTGIQLGSKQSAMVQARLSKRMIELKMSAEQYIDHLRAHPEQESPYLVSLLTTHHTFFFREFAQFEYLTRNGLKQLVEAIRAQGRKTLRVWSAACSYGHEVYSLSMHLNLHLKQIAPDFTFEILGTDVDRESVATSRNGVYKWDEVKGIPAHYLGDHWSRGTGEIAAFVKAKKTLRDPCRFEEKNLTELDQESGPQKFDLIFCRNVLIYFNQQQIRVIAQQLLRRLEPHGLLFLGISESLMGMELPVDFSGPSIYTHRLSGARKIVDFTKGATKGPVPSPAPQEPARSAGIEKPIRLLCVDDSPVVLSLLKKIFSAEPGFEVVATAKNGIEAAEMLRMHPIDAMTLDIHMPGQSGLEYLQKNFGPKHPPVVMVTSVSREDARLGLKCLETGARDFVEKPSLNNLEDKGEELRMKIRCALQHPQASSSLEIAKSFARHPEILNPSRKLRVLVARLADRDRLFDLLNQFSKSDPATLVLIEGAGAVVQGLVEQARARSKLKAEIWNGKDPVTSGLYFADLFDAMPGFAPLFSGRRISLLVLGEVTRSSATWLKGIRAALGGKGNSVQLILEELEKSSKSHQNVKSVASEIVPVSSFTYSSTLFLSRDI